MQSIFKNRRKILGICAVITSFIVTTLSFQNCSPNKLSVSSLSANNYNVISLPSLSKMSEQSSKYKIGAYYFGMFSPQAMDRAVTNIYNQGYQRPEPIDNWWTGVQDLHEGRAFNSVFSTKLKPDDTIFNTWRLADYSHLKPAIGYYNQSNVNTLEKHIQQASENGLSYFSFYWYWTSRATAADPGAGGSEVFADGLKSFLAAKNSQEMEFMLSLCEHGYQFSLPSDDFITVADILVNYFMKPNYLKINGRPAIQLCDVRGIHYSNRATRSEQIGLENSPSKNQAAINAFISILKNKTAEKMGGIHPFVTARSDDPDTYTAVKNQIDAAQCLMPNAIAANSTLYDYKHIAGVVADKNIELADGKSIMPCLMQNLDERPRMGAHYAHKSEFGFPQGYVYNYSDNYFHWSLTKIKQWMDAQSASDSASKHLTIYAWNEWHEGGVIEPNSKDGAKKLGIINEVFGLRKGENACRTTGLCSGGNPVAAPVPVAAPTRSIINGGQILSAGTTLSSPNGRVTLAMQSDCNLVLYIDGVKPLWATYSSGSNCSATFQTDGNLVVHSKGNPIWNSKTYQYAGSYLQIQDDGNLVMYFNGQVVWSTNTSR